MQADVGSLQSATWIANDSAFNAEAGRADHGAAGGRERERSRTRPHLTQSASGAQAHAPAGLPAAAADGAGLSHAAPRRYGARVTGAPCGSCPRRASARLRGLRSSFIRGIAWGRVIAGAVAASCIAARSARRVRRIRPRRRSARAPASVSRTAGQPAAPPDTHRDGRADGGSRRLPAAISASTRTSSARSAVCTRAARVSGSSPEATGTATWASSGPVS